MKKKNLYFSIFWILLGISLIVLDAIHITNNDIYGSLGTAWVCVGLLQLTKYIRYKKNPEYKEKIDTNLNDERIRTNSQKAMSMAGMTTIIIAGLVSLTGLLLNQKQVALIASYIVCLLLILYWLSYIILSLEGNNDKLLLKLEWIIAGLGTLIFIVMILYASYKETNTIKQTELIIHAVIIFSVSMAYSLKIEQIAGFYECKECGNLYIPNLEKMLIAPHMGRTRKMTCPKCGKKSWQKKVILDENKF